MKQNVIAAMLFFSIVANVFGLYVIVLQDDVIDQKIYDLNVSQTAFMIQKANYNKLELQIAKGLCLEPLEMK